MVRSTASRVKVLESESRLCQLETVCTWPSYLKLCASADSFENGSNSTYSRGNCEDYEIIHIKPAEQYLFIIIMKSLKNF